MRIIFFLLLVVFSCRKGFAQNIKILFQGDSLGLVNDVIKQRIEIDGRVYTASLYDVNGNDIYNEYGKDSFILRDSVTHQTVFNFLQDDFVVNVFGEFYSVNDVEPDGSSLMLKKTSFTSNPLLSFIDSLSPFVLDGYMSDTVYSISSALLDSYDYIYLNFWSYNCAPCISKMPNFKYFDVKKVLPIHILIFNGEPDDEELSRAKNIVNENKLYGVNGWKYRLFEESFNATGFPAGVLFNKAGKLIACFSGEGPHDILNFLTFYYK